MKLYKNVCKNLFFIYLKITVSARIGRKMFATAVLDATSVTPAVIIHTTSMITKGGKTIMPANCLPNQSDNPDFLVASDNAYPPPIKYFTLLSKF